jgi:formamidopyrimidine-DNA glycosylase
MPELPEVETVARGLARALEGRRIARIETARKDLRIPFPADLRRVENGRIETVTRRAKYIVMALDNGDALIVHLGMSGRMTVHPGAKRKHDHMTILLDDGTRAVFNDARRFGLVALARQADLDRHPFFAHLGPEPFDSAFTPE